MVWREHTYSNGNGAITTLHGVADLALVTFDALLDTATATVACPIGEDGLCEQANINLNEKNRLYLILVIH